MNRKGAVRLAFMISIIVAISLAAVFLPKISSAQSSGNGATCMFVSAPDTVGMGNTFVATIEVMNSGTRDWTSSYYLRAQNSPSRAYLGDPLVNPPSESIPLLAQPVKQGSTSTFSFTVSNGEFSSGPTAFAWRMSEDGADFGGTCIKVINVINETKTCAIDRCSNIYDHCHAYDIQYLVGYPDCVVSSSSYRYDPQCTCVGTAGCVDGAIWGCKPVCGNGVVEPGEDCDESSACCSGCKFVAASTKCNAASGICEDDAYCTGSSAKCPANVKKAAGTICDTSSGICENDAKCDGSSASCPSKTFKLSTSLCNAASGNCESDAYCSGSSASCPANVKKAAGTTCNSASGICENDAKCDGSSASCPLKTFKPLETLCNSASGICENNAYCTGSSASCPANVKKPLGTVCNSASGTCENDAKCDGSSASCPSKTFKPLETLCNSASGICENNAFCTGSSASCPANVKKAAGTICDTSSGICQNDAKCDGSTSTCPAKTFKPSDTLCNSSSGICENSAYCSGSSASCPSKTFKPSTTICRQSTNPFCDPNEYCTGFGAFCPSDNNTCGSCGNNLVETGEQCELPETNNNTYCNQTISGCEPGGKRLGVRDAFGFCNNKCGCIADQFAYSCIKGQCGAVCNSTSDYNLLGSVCSFGCDAASSCSFASNCSIEQHCGGAGSSVFYYEGQCSGTGCSFKQQNCDALDHYENWTSYCKGDELRQNRTFHDYFCTLGGCNSTTGATNDTLIKDCNSLDGWYDMNETKYVSAGQCNEKEQKKQEFRNYTCGTGPACGYIIEGGNRWIDTGGTRNKPVGTVCDNGIFCDGADKCDAIGVCKNSGPIIGCDDGNFCTKDYCDEASKQCKHNFTGSNQTNITLNTTKRYGQPFYSNGTSEWINSSTKITLNVSGGDVCYSNISMRYRITRVDDVNCFYDSQCQILNGSGSGSWKNYSLPFQIGESSCHLIEFFSSSSNITEVAKRQCAFVDNTGPLANKTVSEPKEQWSGSDAHFYDIKGRCWNLTGIECWKVTTMTPVILDCKDPEPHPSGNESICFQVGFDGDDKTAKYCSEFSGKIEDGYCCLNRKLPVNFYFREESEHQLKIFCKDALGNRGGMDEEMFKVQGSAFTIKLNKKWNLVSVPFVLLNDSMNKVFANTSDKIASVWSYDAKSNKWYIFTPDGIDNDNILEMLPGWGYWVLAKNDTELKIGGSLFSPLTTPPARDIIKGWNLIGYYGTENSSGSQQFAYGGPNGTSPYGSGKQAVCMLASLVDVTKGYPVWSSLLTYWETFNPDLWIGLDLTDRMDAGAGYWLFAIRNATYAPSTICPMVK